MVNEVNFCDNRGWHKNRCKDSEYSQKSCEMFQPMDNYRKKVRFDRPYGTGAALNSESSNCSPDLCVSSQVSSETDKDKSSQQPSIICGSFMQIMVNPMRLQDHEITAWLDRLVEAKENRQDKRQHPYRNYRKPYNEGKQPGDKWSKPQLRNRVKPAQELEVQQIMDNFNCQYNDAVEAVDLYNLDVEECTSA